MVQEQKTIVVACHRTGDTGMINPTNKMRAGWARMALEVFCSALHSDHFCETDPDIYADAISDILHLAKINRLDIDDITMRGINNFNAEVSETEQENG